MDLGLNGRRAAVAASSRGLGLGAARALAAEGARVAICGRDRNALAAAAAELGDAGLALTADVATPEGAADFARRAERALGGIDVLVTNGGGPPAGDSTAVTVASYAEAFAQNALAAIAMCDAVLPGMRARRWGRIVAITSVAVRQPIPGLILSNTARAGLTGYLKTLAREVATDGITVNSVLPGSHDTDRLRALHGGDLGAAAAAIPARRVGDPADFGAVVAFLCSEQANFVTGHALTVDGGASGGLL